MNRINQMHIWSWFPVLIALSIILGVKPCFAGITGSKHDLSGKGWGTNQICIFCHAPHNANKTVSDSPLWNHQVTMAAYTVYTSPTMDVTPEQPGGPSRLCLSCHDGTVAIDNYGGRTGASHIISGATNLGTDLSNDHPVSMNWFHQTVGDSSAACMKCHDWIHDYGYPLRFYGGGYSGTKIECGTCHDPHNDVSNLKMLRVSLTGSELCFQCHTDKGP